MSIALNICQITMMDHFTLFFTSVKISVTYKARSNPRSFKISFFYRTHCEVSEFVLPLVSPFEPIQMSFRLFTNNVLSIVKYFFPELSHFLHLSKQHQNGMDTNLRYAGWQRLFCLVCVQNTNPTCR